MKNTHSVVCTTTLLSIIDSNLHNTLDNNIKELYLEEYDSLPEGWDCVFMNCPSYSELNEEQRKERREALEIALNRFQ